MGIRRVNLGNICEITSSTRIFANEYKKEGIPFFRSKEIIELGNGSLNVSEKFFISEERFEKIKKEKPIPQEGDIFLSAIGANLGEAFLNNLDYEFYFKDGNIIWFRNFDDCIISEYIYYWMKSKDFEKQYNNFSIGAAQKALTIDSLKEYKIPIIEIEKQKKTVEILSRLDAKINNNNHINNNLEELMKTIYQRWFIEFEFPNEEGKPYKSSGGKLVYNEELKQNIPEKWEVKVLNDISNFVSGFAFSSNDYTKNGKYKLYTIKNVQDGNIVSIVDNTLNELPVNMPNECLLKPKDLIMSLTGNVGRVGLVYENNALLNQRVLKIEPQNNLCYLYSLYRNDFMKSRCEKISSGTSQKNLSPIELGKQKVLYSKKIVEKFEETNRFLIDTYVNNLIENQKLNSLKEFLLPMLMNGQINVDEIEI